MDAAQPVISGGAHGQRVPVVAKLLRWGGELRPFLGPRIFKLLVLGAISGLGMFVVELVFAAALQLFLVVFGVAQNPPHPHLSGPQFRDPRWVAGLLFLVGAARSVLQWLQTYLQNMAFEDFRFSQWDRLINWAFSSRSVSTGRLLTLFGERTANSANGLRAVQLILIHGVVGVFLAISLLLIAPLATMGLFALIGLLWLPLRRMDRRLKSASISLTEEWERSNFKLFSGLRNLLLIQIYGTTEVEKGEIRQSLRRCRDYYVNYCTTTATKFVLPQFLGVCVICLITLGLRGQIDPSQVVAFVYLLVRFFQSLSEAGRSWTSLVLAWPQLRDLVQWWRTTRGGTGTKPRASGTLGTDLEGESVPVAWSVQNLGFSYPHSSVLIRDFSLQIAPGELCVVQGESGKGKSTLVHLLLGLEEPIEGRVLAGFAGSKLEPLTDFRRRLLKRIGYVGAESFLIEGSIRQNLCYGLLRTPSEDEMAEALRQAECDFVAYFERRLDHPITEQGQGLSAGQKQRLCLARALLRRPSALLLDEATANLDLQTEARLVATLAKLKGRVTVIAVTHRDAMNSIADQRILFGVSNTPRVISTRGGAQ